MPQFSIEFWVGTIIAVTIFVVGVGITLAMDTKTSGELHFAIGCFLVSSVIVLYGIGVWQMSVSWTAKSRLPLAYLAFALIALCTGEAIRWAHGRHLRAATGTIPPISPTAPPKTSAAPTDPIAPRRTPSEKHPRRSVPTQTSHRDTETSTEDQLRLRAAIRRVLSFPNAVQDSKAPPTIVEALLIDQTPRKLFNVLLQYDEDAISGIPESGPLLLTFVRKYYQWQQDEVQFQNELLKRIGSMVTVRLPAAWAIYLKYAILRFSGMSKDQVVAGGNFLNYDITWEDAERVYALLSNDPAIAKRFSDSFSQYRSFVEISAKLAENGR